MYHSVLLAGDTASPGSGSAAAVPASPPRHWRKALDRPLLRAVWREPLTHFVLLGALIFAAADWIEARSTRYAITVSDGDVTRIVNSYRQQYGADPAPVQLRTMIDNQIREEILLREGLALGLDRNDEIVRRRIAQKYEFLQQDNAVPRRPSENELAAWFADNQARFALPERRSYAQVYFSIDQRGEEAARALTSAALTQLNGGKRVAGDPFPGPQSVGALSEADTSRLFGGDKFARQVFRSPVGRWVGPLRSGFGWHLVRVEAIEPGRGRNLDEVRAEASAAWSEADRAARNAERFAELRSRYKVTRADQP
jgi:hypothetical protein